MDSNITDITENSACSSNHSQLEPSEWRSLSHNALGDVRGKMAEGGAADLDTQRAEVAALLKTQLRKGDTWWGLIITFLMFRWYHWQTLWWLSKLKPNRKWARQAVLTVTVLAQQHVSYLLLALHSTNFCREYFYAIAELNGLISTLSHYRRNDLIPGAVWLSYLKAGG